MERSLLVAVCLLGVSLCVCRAAKPLGGRFAGEDAITQTLYLDKEAKEETVRAESSPGEREGEGEREGYLLVVL